MSKQPLSKSVYSSLTKYQKIIYDTLSKGEKTWTELHDEVALSRARMPALMSKETFSKNLLILEAKGLIERSVFPTRPPTTVYRVSKPTISPKKRFLKIMEDYSIVTMAPVCPVISGAHAVLYGASAMVLPLNAYICIGLSETYGSGGNVEMDLEESTRGRMAEPSYTEMERVKRKTIETICEILDINKQELPNYRVRVASDIDLSLGCGSSGALALANMMALLASRTLQKIAKKNFITKVGQLPVRSEVYDLTKEGAFILEQFIHGKESVPKHCAPYSSGASVICSMEANKGRLLNYKLVNWDKLKHNREVIPKAEVKVVSKELSVPLIFVLGIPKSTADALRRRATMRDRLGEDLGSAFYEFWDWLTDRLEKVFSMLEKKQIDRKEAIEKVSQLLKIQNGLYRCLGLDNPDFTKLIEITSRPSIGGSIIGGGIGGACVFTSNDPDSLRSLIVSRHPDFQILESRFLQHPYPAQILKIKP